MIIFVFLIVVVVIIFAVIFGRNDSKKIDTGEDNLLVTETDFYETDEVEGFEISEIKFVNGEASALFIAKLKNTQEIKKEARFDVTAYDKKNNVIKKFMMDCGEIEANAEYDVSIDIEGSLKNVERLEYQYKIKE